MPLVKNKMNSWLHTLLKQLDAGTSSVLVMIAHIRGSAPREQGAYMVVDEQGFCGSIGGGALEYQALQIARSLLENPSDRGFERTWRDIALGPNLGQCCGGHVTLLFESYAPSLLPHMTALSQGEGSILHAQSSDELPIICDKTANLYDAKTRSYSSAKLQSRDHLYIYGAGHVGRALMDVTAGLQLQRFWVDDDKSRFPEKIANDIEKVIARDMSLIANHAPANSYHIVLTYSHQLDEEIVRAILHKNEFLQLGLIGSRTKAARFKNRFAKEGLSTSVIERMICPIGLMDITSKKPEHVALSIAGQIAQWCEQRYSLGNHACSG